VSHDPKISRLLADWTLPNGAAKDELVALVYDELRAQVRHRDAVRKFTDAFAARVIGSACRPG
jgi:hypothetical protein